MMMDEDDLDDDGDGDDDENDDEQDDVVVVLEITDVWRMLVRIGRCTVVVSRGGGGRGRGVGTEGSFILERLWLC